MNDKKTECERNDKVVLLEDEEGGCSHDETH